MPDVTRPRPDARLYKAISDSEHRLMDVLERGLKDVKDLIQERKVETNELEDELKKHVNSDGHPLLEARVKNLETEVNSLKHRPLQNWQVISVVVFIFFNFLSILLSLAYDLHAILGH